MERFNLKQAERNRLHKSGASPDPFCEKAMEQLWQSLLLYVRSECSSDEELDEYSARQRVIQLLDEDLHYGLVPGKLLCERMKKLKAEKSEHLAVSAYNRFISVAGNNVGSIVVSLRVSLIEANVCSAPYKD